MVSEFKRELEMWGYMGRFVLVQVNTTTCKTHALIAECEQYASGDACTGSTSVQVLL
jgi:hypothetical protein